MSENNLIGALSGLQVADDQVGLQQFELREAAYLAPFSRVDGQTFFAFASANDDGVSHFLALGSNVIGFEDLPGGGDWDYDDQVMSFHFSTTPF